MPCQSNHLIGDRTIPDYWGSHTLGSQGGRTGCDINLRHMPQLLKLQDMASLCITDSSWGALTGRQLHGATRRAAAVSNMVALGGDWCMRLKTHAR